ncbi:MAG: tRNA lysidine(34) synthetase TilS [Pseudomonadota bacterium]|nr:tRNA lysidine(34) synthetase TilS [Pseudomonadota bacterium]
MSALSAATSACAATVPTPEPQPACGQQRLARSISQSAALLPKPPRQLLLGYSGGLDSSLLLHLLARIPGLQLRAIHVHHGLQAQADDWAQHCQQQCQQLGVPLIIERVQVENRGDGLEAAARRARHAAFARHLEAGQYLVLAHHLDDQAETFLLRALRGAGPDGLAAMRPWRSFAPGILWRPLLTVSRAEILACAQESGIAWIDDPSNQDPRFERNWLRQQIMPRLQQRLPEAARNIAQAARLQMEAVSLLQAGDEAVRATSPTLALPPLRQLPPARAARVFRHWARQQGLPPLPARAIDWLQTELARPADDRQSELRWADTRLLRWRDTLYQDPGIAALPDDFQTRWDGRAPLLLPNGLCWQLEGATGFATPLRVLARQGGEKIQLPGRQHRHLLKHALQQQQIAPWLRRAWPLLIDPGGQVLAHGELHSAELEAWLAQQQTRLLLQIPAKRATQEKNQ